MFARRLAVACLSLLALGAPGLSHAQTDQDAQQARVAAGIPEAATCLVPAQPGGGFDLTCNLVSAALETLGAFLAPVRVSYVPGGVGASAFNLMTGPRRAEPGTLVAFSEGSIYNLALGRFGAHDLQDVRWIAGLGLDHGAVVVRDDAPWADLSGLLADMKANPRRVAFGGGGTIGGQDWMRAALTAQAVGVSLQSMRFVAFEGGGNCVQALVGGHVQACMNDVADSATAIQAGEPLKILAIYAPARLPGRLSDIPTAREQGVALDWPVVRGVYAGPDMPQAALDWWRESFAALMQTPDFARQLEARNLQPLGLTGPALDDRLSALMAEAHTMADRFGPALTAGGPRSP